MASGHGGNFDVEQAQRQPGFERENLITRHSPTERSRHGAGRHNESSLGIVAGDDRNRTWIQVIFMPMGANNSARSRHLRTDGWWKGARLSEDVLHGVGEVWVDVKLSARRGLENESRSSKPPRDHLAGRHNAGLQTFAKFRWIGARFHLGLSQVTASKLERSRLVGTIIPDAFSLRGPVRTQAPHGHRGWARHDRPVRGNTRCKNRGRFP